MKSRRFKVIAGFILILIGGYTGITLWKNAGATVPPELSDARVQGALISENIVNLAVKSSEDLSAINELDKKGKYAEALALTGEVIKQSQEIRDKAVALSDQIGIMTKSLSDVHSLEARQALLDSITSRLALVSRLINYSAYLAQLLDVLRSGAQISIWINGPASQIAHYADCDCITEGAEAVLNLLASRDRIGVARIAHPAGEFIVVLPQRAAPIIAFATQQSPS